MSEETTGRSFFKPFPEVIAALHSEHKSGILELKEKGRTYRIHLDQGSVVAVESDDPGQTLSQRLMNAGVVAPWDVELAVSIAQDGKGKKLGQILVDMGILQKEALIQELNAKLKDTFTALFDIPRANYVFNEMPPVGPSWKYVPTHTTADLILDGCRRMQTLLPVTRKLQNPDAYLSISSDARLLFQRAHLSNLEKLILHRLRQPQQVQTVVNMVGQDRVEVLKVLYGLITAGFLNLTVERPAETPQVATPVLPAEAPAEAPVTRKEVVEKFQQVGVVSHYLFLDIIPSARNPDIEEAFQKLAAKFHPDHAVNESLSDLKTQLDSIFLTAVKARNTLVDAKARAEYDKSLQNALGRDETTMVKAASAATNYSYAQKMLSRGNVQDAVRALLQAVENDPSNPVYPFKLAQILKRLPSQQKEAELYFKRALELDPLNTDMMLELFKLYRNNNMKAKAEALIKHAANLDPMNGEIKEELDKYFKPFVFPVREVACFLGGILLTILLYELFLTP
jgi:hypothetical protein